MGMEVGLTWRRAGLWDRAAMFVDDSLADWAREPARSATAARASVGGRQRT